MIPLPIGLAAAALLLAAGSVLPGCLGILMFTHKFAARPTGAFFTYVFSPSLYYVSLLLMAGAVATAQRQHAFSWMLALTVAGFAGISLFGFLLHTRFMFRPIRHPRFISVEEAIRRFGENEEIIGVLDEGGRPFAFITRMARRPHIVYNLESEFPFIMSHCILSHSSMAYAVTSNFTPGRIYIASVLANNLVFYDSRTHCSVTQVLNRPQSQEQDLQCLPTVASTLGSWGQLHPDSKVWFRKSEWRDAFYLKLLARASVIDPASRDLVYPLTRRVDPRLPMKSYVLGVRLGNHAKAYPEDLFRRDAVLQDELGKEPLVFFAFQEGALVQLFSRRLKDGCILDFEAASPGHFRDVQTGSVWDVNGGCVDGALRGAKLHPIPHYNKIFWFVWAEFYPHTACHEQAAKVRDAQP